MLHKFLKAPGGQRQLLACLIHRVAPVKDTATRLRRGLSKRERLDAWSRQSITLHKTHLGMAVQVCRSLNRLASLHPQPTALPLPGSWMQCLVHWGWGTCVSG